MSDDKGINATAGDTCPNCGYCPHCKRSSQPWYPYPWYPYSRYPYSWGSTNIVPGQYGSTLTDTSVDSWSFTVTASTMPIDSNIATTDAGGIA